MPKFPASAVLDLLTACERLGALRQPLDGAQVQPMLAEPREQPFDDPAWLFELKYDGFRAILSRDGAAAAVHYRRGAEAGRVFPELCRALVALPCKRVVLDGELVVLDERGRPAFQRMQKRALLTAPRDIAAAARALPATYFAFDLLGFEDHDLRGLPLLERKRLLQALLTGPGPLRAVEHVEGQGRALFESVRELGLEGIVGKRAQSAYRGGRSRDWQKVRVDRVADFAVVGSTKAEGSRTGFGALHVAYRGAAGFVYIGRVGGGFDQRELEWAEAQLRPLGIEKPPCRGPLPPGRGNAWVRPKLVIEVRYKEITEDGLLRQPTFLRFREDKSAEECGPPGDAALSAPAAIPTSAAGIAAAASIAAAAGTPARLVHETNRDKVFWPAEGFTKGDLLDYTRAIAPWLLPYLRDRPLVLTRYPDGINGKSFFQKNAPARVPSWIRTARVPDSESDREIHFIVCDDLDTLLYLVNLGTIPLHLWSSRFAAPAHPDWCILDLDPKEAPFAWVIQLALAARTLCDELGLPSYCKTSGQKGMHVLVPLGGQLDHAQAITLGELLAHAIERRHREISTTARSIPARKGRVYLDYLQNGQGKTIAAPFSARPVPGGTVSMPLFWSEVDGALDPKRFTLKTAPERMERLGADPFAPVLAEKPDLPAALGKLLALMR